MATGKISTARLQNLKPGKFGDGGNLWLYVKPNKQAYWIFRYRYHGHSKEMSLGALTDVTASRARELATRFRNALRKGFDPRAERARDNATAMITFCDAAGRMIKAKQAEWRSSKHRQQWESTLREYAFPHIGSLNVAEIEVENVLAALEPIWASKSETASRLRQRIESVLDYATARRYREGLNPARWKGNLDTLLPKPSKIKKVQHFAALPYQEMPIFMQALAQQKSIGALALRFTILTAARTGEVVGMEKSEIVGSVWTIPGNRMKAGREHRVPLSQQALATLEQVPVFTGSRFVFNSTRHGHKLSTGAMTAVLKRMGRRDVTAHGFRSSFRDWAAEQTNFPRQVVEAALAHSLADKTEAAYLRSDLLVKRAKLMQTWGDYCTTPRTVGDVIPIQGSANGKR